MGNVIIPQQARAFFDSVWAASKGFRAVVTDVLKGGDYEYIFTDQDFSFCDPERRIISIGVRSGDINRLNSDIIFEMCNAYQASVGRKPKLDDHPTAAGYARAVELSEWMAAKLHYAIMSQLEAADASWGPLNRFRGGFTRAVKPWTDFENYLEEQTASGHTDRVASHHPAYGM